MDLAPIPLLMPAGIPSDEPAPSRLLIVDDEVRIGQLYRQLLAAPDREVEACTCGRDAIERVGSEDFDLVVLDLRLPDIHGSDVLDWITRNRPATAVVVFSAEDRIDAAILAQRRGAIGFLRKQADPDEVLDTVAEVLRRRRIEREHALMARRLEHSERLHRFLVEHSPDIIYTLDEAGRFVFINQRIESLLGYTSEELIGQHYTVLVHEDDVEHVRYAFAERRSGKRATFNHEVRLRGKNDGVRCFENRMVVAILCSRGLYRDGSGTPPDYVGTSGVLRDITDRKKAEETIAFQAFHDLLTGLPNRGLFKDRLELAINQARRSGQRVGLMYLDIDRFKHVNDTFGHAEGDELLRDFANRVRNCLRCGDTLARQGGDEFTVLLPDLVGNEAAQTIARKILCELARPFRIAGHELRTSASIGIAIFPDDGESAEMLMRNADAAMYHIKAHGKNGFLEYADGVTSGEPGQMLIEEELGIALRDSQLELHFQPQVSLRQGRVIGVEALVRWRHPQRGLLGPDRFIPIAEESGLIFSLSDWVLDQSCALLASWAAAGHEERTIAVNISAVEFERADFVDRIMRPIRARGVAPWRVEIEITESLLMVDAERVIDKVVQLRENGLRVAIDDFGTRYSSLNYLRRFRVSNVKIDQSFVRDIENQGTNATVVEAIVGIARGFSLDFLAEGVETTSQAQSLSRLGCDVMQGYLFSRPIPAAELESYLADEQGLRGYCRELAAERA